MGLYKFLAIESSGKKISGSIDAESLMLAKQKLLQRNLFLVSLDPQTSKQALMVLSKKELLTFTLEMTRLLQAGLALYETLSLLEEKYRSQKSHPLFLDLCDSIRSGKSFSESLSKHKKIFDLLYVSMVANSEKTGKLTECLQLLSDLLKRQMQLKKQISSALLYPGLLLGFCVVILSSLIFYVVPSLQELFDGKALHPMTQLVFSLSTFATENLTAILGSFFCLIGLFVFGISSTKWRKRFHYFLGKVPGIKILLAKVALSRFFRASSALIEGGLPALSAFSEAKYVMGHLELEKLVVYAEKKISEGVPLHEPFLHHPLIPSLVPRMLDIAQASGRLSFMLLQIADIYQDEIETHLQRFTTLAQPVLLLFLGAVVGFVLLAVLLPLTDVSSFVS